MLYKAGDRVRVRENLQPNKIYGGMMFVDEMKHLRGEIVAICDVFKYGKAEGYYIDESKYVLTDEMVENICDKAFYECYKNLINKEEKENMITDVKILAPNKVVEVFFEDGGKEKMICHEEDTFDLRNCLFIAIAKHLYKSEYTLEGIEYKANELKYLKKYVKIVDSALKAYSKKEEEKKKQKEAEEAAKALAKRKKEKLAKYKEKRKEKWRKERIKEMTEAYVDAMMIADEIACGVYSDCAPDPDCENCECRLENNCRGADDYFCKYEDDLK